MGCIRQRTPGSWQILYYHDGKQESKTVRATKRDAERLLREIERAIDLGEYEVKPKQAVTFGDLAKEWMLQAEREKAPSTVARYEQALRLHLLPALGGEKVSDLGPLEIHGFYKGLLERGMSPSSVKTMNNVVSGVLGMAEELEIIPRNPALRVKKPSGSVRPKRPPLTDEQITAVLSAAEGTMHQLPVALAVTMGLRCGEICGLLWEDIDFNEGVLTINRTAVALPGRGVFLQDHPKTETSRRRVHLTRAAASALEREPRVSPLVLHRGGKPRLPSVVSNNIKHLCRSIGVEVSAHTLRHAHASHLFRLGAHPKVVMERLGHGTISETLDTYTHTLASQQAAASIAIDDALRGQ